MVSLKLSGIDKQKLMGAVTSMASGSLSNGLYLLLVNFTSLNPVFAAVLALQILGGIFAYSFDVVFAKEKFNGIEIPYSHLGYRTKYLLKSVFTEMVIRFIVAIIITSIVYFFIYKSFLKFAEENGFTFRYYKYVYAVLISMSLYFLFNHIILFDYVYMETDRPITVDMTVIGIMLICLIAYCFWHIQQKPEKETDSMAMHIR
jgi:hypothetical protein